MGELTAPPNLLAGFEGPLPGAGGKGRKGKGWKGWEKNTPSPRKK